MYQFHIVQNEDSSWRFELGGIHLIVDDYVVKDEKHWFTNPNRVIAYFNINGNLYGIANPDSDCCTAEDFYEIMKKQYSYFQ
ncbi:MAG: hypothetical protein EOP49_06045 [Sphingobacteriales bacterium]|nr:MAG: hypothetical protein EOP49_06045 [Sphingobacteriales bacterium]